MPKPTDPDNYVTLRELVLRFGEDAVVLVNAEDGSLDDNVCAEHVAPQDRFDTDPDNFFPLTPEEWTDALLKKFPSGFVLLS